MSKTKTKKWKTETLLLHVSIFTTYSMCLRCKQPDWPTFAPFSLPWVGLEWVYDLTLANDIKKKVYGVLGRHRKRHAHLFTSWLLLGQNMMPEIALVTMLLKNDAITWENNQVKQIWEPHTWPTLHRTCPTAGLLTIWDHVFLVLKANLSWDFLLFATKCFLR